MVQYHTPPTFSATIVIVIVIATVLLLIIIIIMHKIGVRLYTCTLIPYIRSASQQPSRCPEHCSCHGMSRCMQTSGTIKLLLLRMTVTNDAACRRTFTCIGVAYVHCPNWVQTTDRSLLKGKEQDRLCKLSTPVRELCNLAFRRVRKIAKSDY
jgi:hypothetical protein